jgi:hypothetical protein
VCAVCFNFALETAQLAVASEGKGVGYQSACITWTDAEKTNEAQHCGWMLIRCNTRTVENGKCIQWVENALKGETCAAASRAS